jgi:hypothetical protein
MTFAVYCVGMTPKFRGNTRFILLQIIHRCAEQTTQAAAEAYYALI